MILRASEKDRKKCRFVVTFFLCCCSFLSQFECACFVYECVSAKKAWKCALIEKVALTNFSSSSTGQKKKINNSIKIVFTWHKKWTTTAVIDFFFSCLSTGSVWFRVVFFPPLLLLLVAMCFFSGASQCLVFDQVFQSNKSKSKSIFRFAQLTIKKWVRMKEVDRQWKHRVDSSMSAIASFFFVCPEIHSVFWLFFFSVVIVSGIECTMWLALTPRHA